MGNLSNLYVSQSFQSLIHLGTNGVATPALTTLQDGYGNSIGIEVNTAGDLFLSGSLTASLQQGYVWVGNASGKTTTVSTSSFGGGSTINTGSLLVTASVINDDITFTKGDGSQFTIQVATGSFALSASFAETASIARNLVITARNGNPSTLPIGTIVHITSAVGDNPIFNTASFNTELLSANTLGVLRQAALTGTDVEVVVQGKVVGVNTDPALGYAAGDVIYLSSSGQFTRVQPQAPNQIVVLGQVLRAQQNNGSIYVSINNGWELNELHNVQINNAQTGDLIQYESSSYGLWKNKSISTLGLATTGSNTFVGQQTIQNTLVIEEQGNPLIYTTFNQSGISNKLEVSQAGASGINFNVTELNLNGSLTASLQQGYVWVGDSTGKTTTVATSSFGSGGTINTASFATTGSNTFRGDQTVLGDIRISGSTDNHLYINRPGGSDILRLGVSNNGNTFDFHITGSADQQLWLIDNQGGTWLNTFFGGIQSEGKTTINAPFTASQGAQINGGDLRVANNLTASLQQGYVWVGNAAGRTITVATSSFAGLAPVGVAITGSNTFIGNQTITGSVFISSSAALGLSNTNGTSVQYFGNSFGSNIGIYKVSDATEIGLALDGAAWTTNWGNGPIIYVNNTPGDTYEGVFGFQNKTNYTDGRITALKRLDVSGSLSTTGTFTSSLQQGYVWVGDAAGRTTTVATSSFGGGGSAFPFTGNAVITGSLLISGSATNDLIVNGGIQVTGSTPSISNTITQGQIIIDSASVQSVVFGGSIACSGFNGTQQQQITVENAEGTIGLFVDANGGYIRDFNPNTSLYSNAIKLQPYSSYGSGQVQLLRPLEVSGNTTITGSLTISGSAATDLAVIGDSVFTGTTTITGSNPQFTIGGTAGNTVLFPDSLSISSSLYRNLQGPRAISINKLGFAYPVFNSLYSAQSSSFLYNYTDNLSATASYNVGVFDNNFTQDVELYLETTTTNGVQFKDIDGNSGVPQTFLRIAPNYGTNPPLEFKRGMQITGSLSIQSGSALPVSTGSAILTWNASTGRVTQAPYSTIISASVSSGEFWSTTTQSGSAGVSGSVTFNNSASFYNTSIVNGTRLTVANGGVYNIQFSAQIETSAGADTLWIWFKKNGNNIGASASKAVLANNTAQIMTVNILDEAAANDYYEIAYQNLNGHATVLAEAASGNIPAIPSVIATIFQIR